MKTLLYTCGYGDVYSVLAEMLMESLWYTGYHGDKLIFTDRDLKPDWSEVINVNNHTDRALLCTDKKMTFHQRVGKVPRGFDLDYFTCKYLPGTFVDKEKYDFILYVDSDILFNPVDIDEIFLNKNIVTEYHGWKIFTNLKALQGVLSEDEIPQCKSIQSFSGAAIGVPKRHYDFYDKYRDIYLQTISMTPHDQPALNLCLFRNLNIYNPSRLENRKYWRHYWGKNKEPMFEEYRKRNYAVKPTSAHLKINT